MQPDSTVPAPRKQPSGAEKRRQRVERGEPRYTAADIASRNKRYKPLAQAAWARFSERINAIKLERGCADCGYNAHPAALDFDHLPGAEKWRGVSRLMTVRWEKVAEEIAKCEVVCANCHRIRTAERRNG